MYIRTYLNYYSGNIILLAESCNEAGSVKVKD